MLVGNADAFYFGSVAPDTIGSKVPCSREDKKRVHLRDGIRDAEWLDKEKMELFKVAVRGFVDQHISNEKGSQRDFNIGYLVHLLTDEWNHRTIRQTMLKTANEMNVLESDREFFYMMTNDLEALDKYLLEGNREIEKILEKLLGEQPQYELKGFIEKEYIEGSIQWWRNVYLHGIKQRTLKYIQEKDIDEFIDIATKEILDEIKALL